MGFLGALGSAFGSAFDFGLGQITAKQQFDRNVGQIHAQERFQQTMADKQMGFQERMSSTAYQRAAQDIKSAGLNPMMMFGSGDAASTPAGATASGGAATAPLVRSDLIASALELQRKDAENRLIKSNRDVAEEVKRRTVEEVKDAGNRAKSSAAQATRDQAMEGWIKAHPNEYIALQLLPNITASARDAAYTLDTVGSWFPSLRNMLKSGAKGNPPIIMNRDVFGVETPKK